jgi:hypothetical protein
MDDYHSDEEEMVDEGPKNNLSKLKYLLLKYRTSKLISNFFKTYSKEIIEKGDSFNFEPFVKRLKLPESYIGVACDVLHYIVHKYLLSPDLQKISMSIAEFRDLIEMAFSAGKFIKSLIFDDSKSSKSSKQISQKSS